MPSDAPTTNGSRWDVIIMGGALSGSSTAFQLLRKNPGLKVLIIERNAEFSRRVGESTVEVSAFFLGRVLGLSEHLNQKHLVKQGMRFWFHNPKTHSLSDCSETGPAYNVRFPGYQVDRAVLDEEVLERAIALGATVWRSTRITSVSLQDGGLQTVAWETNDGTSGECTARWLVDASGIAAILARKNGWLQTNTEHPIASCWSRWSQVKSWDSQELADRFPEWARRTCAVRMTATNHVVGKGWWSWWIPLKGGDVSVGIVYDQRIVELPAGEHLGSRLKTFLQQHPVARELLSEAQWNPGDVHFRRNCAYSCTQIAGDGYVLVGDAAGFMDPFYSPGMDWIAFTTSAASTLIATSLSGQSGPEQVAIHNSRFKQSYTRWFEGIYRDKYFYMGDQELMTLAFRLDLGLYYIGVVSPPFRQGAEALNTPAFARPGAGVAAMLIALYNRRLAAIARSRMARGTWGKTNNGRYVPFMSYQLDRALPARVLGALASWLALELREGWRTWRSTPEPFSPAAVSRGTETMQASPMDAVARDPLV